MVVYKCYNSHWHNGVWMVPTWERRTTPHTVQVRIPQIHGENSQLFCRLGKETKNKIIIFPISCIYRYCDLTTCYRIHYVEWWISPSLILTVRKWALVRPDPKKVGQWILCYLFSVMEIFFFLTKKLSMVYARLIFWKIDNSYF